jgi:drug/metabolite transporter (DMT)-like permease
LAALLFGASTPAAKLLLGDASPFLLAGILYLGSGLGLGAAWLVRRAPGEAPLRGGDWGWLAAATLAGGVAGPVLLLYGLAESTAAAASLLLNLEGVLTALIAWFAFREHFHLRTVAGMAAIVAGGLVLSWPAAEGARLAPGAGAVALACLAWAVDNNLTRRISGGDPVQVAMVKGLVAGAVNTIIALAAGAAWPGWGHAGLVALVGLAGYGASLVLYVLALRHLGTARTGAYFSASPFVGALIGVAALGEPVTASVAVAAAFIGLGVALHLSERHAHEHAHQALLHDHRHVHDEHHRHSHAPGAPAGEPHSHPHVHEPLRHSHPHYPDLHHRHGH